MTSSETQRLANVYTDLNYFNNMHDGNNGQRLDAVLYIGCDQRWSGKKIQAEKYKFPPGLSTSSSFE